MRLTKDHDLIQALAAQCANQAFRNAILPWGRQNGPLAVSLRLIRPECRGVSNKRLPGLTRTAAFVIWGMTALTSSSRFAISSERKYVDPVTFPPGRARLVTRPAQNSNQHSALGA